MLKNKNLIITEIFHNIYKIVLFILNKTEMKKLLFNFRINTQLKNILKIKKELYLSEIKKIAKNNF